MIQDIDILLKGRRFKKILEDAYGAYRKRFALKQIDIEILIFMYKHTKVTASDIYRTLNLNKGQVSKSMFSLCENGFLLAGQNQSDRRYVVYEITEKGMQVVSELGNIYNHLIDRVLDGITEAEEQVICRVTQKLLANIDSLECEFKRNKFEL